MASLGLLLHDYKRGLWLDYVDAGTLSIAAGSVVVNDDVYRQSAATTITFANLDTGTEAVGTNYYVYAVLNASALDFTISASASAPTGFTNYQLIGWFHNKPSSDISKYSVASGIDVDWPERGPRPGMVQHPSGFMIDIDRKSTRLNSSHIPLSRMPSSA